MHSFFSSIVPVYVVWPQGRSTAEVSNTILVVIWLVIATYVWLRQLKLSSDQDATINKQIDLTNAVRLTLDQQIYMTQASFHQSQIGIAVSMLIFLHDKLYNGWLTKEEQEDTKKQMKEHMDIMTKNSKDGQASVEQAKAIWTILKQITSKYPDLHTEPERKPETP